MADLRKDFSSYSKSKEASKQTISGLLGIPINGEHRVNHPNRNGFVYVRLRGNQSEVIQAFNDKVAPVYDLPVLVQRNINGWAIVGRDTYRYQDWGTSASFLPQHGDQHSFNKDTGVGGGDIVWVYGNQFMPMLGMPSGTGGPNIIVSPYLAKKDDGSWIYLGGSGTSNLLQYKPTTNQGVLVLVYADRETGNFGYIVGSGTMFAGTITGSAAIAQYIPTLTGSNFMPVSVVRLVSGTTAIDWSNIYDAKQYYSGDGGGGGSSIPALTADRLVLTDSSGNLTTVPYIRWDSGSESLLVGETGVTDYVTIDKNEVSIRSQTVSPAFYILAAGAAISSFFIGERARGDITNPTGVLDNDTIVRLRGRAHDGSAMSNTQAEFRYDAFGNWNTSQHGTVAKLLLTPSGTTTLNEVVKWAGNGDVFITGSIYLPAGQTYNISGSPHIHGFSSASVALTGQVADIGSTNFVNAGIAGTYRVNYYLEVTTADVLAGTLTLTISWTDDAGATTFSTTALPLTAAGRVASPAPIFIRLASSNVAYSTTHTGILGTSVYRLYMTCERLS